VPRSLTWVDRLRIERATWTLDALLQDLPGRSRRAIRRELRDNLRAATAAVGSATAVRELGNLRRVAAEYLDAEYGAGRPRPRWVKGMFWALLVELAFGVSWFVGDIAYLDGVLTADPHATGSFTWQGPGSWAVTSTETLVDGQLQAAEANISLWFFVLLVGVFALGGRMWRILPPWRRRSTRQRLAAE
jgi:hypothetical protein